jgi:ATP-dependent DNA helicase RecG
VTGVRSRRSRTNAAPPRAATSTLLPNASIASLRGVGPALQEKLARLRIHTLLDLLLNLPHRYQDRTHLTPLNALHGGTEALVVGRVLDSRITYGRRRGWLVTLGDERGFLNLRFFHFNERQRTALANGMYVRCFGEVRAGPNGFEMVHPEYKVFPGVPDSPEPRMTPVYPTTEGLTQARLGGLVTHALVALDAWIPPDLSEWLPADRRIDLRTALRLLHQPPAGIDATALEMARSRIAIDELVSNLIVLKRHKRARESERTTALPRSQQLGRQLLKRLGFELTGAQRRVLRDVLLDLERDVPTLRLIQGDVGSGKTVVAAFAAIRAAEQGCQTAIMAPTEILAEQHYLNFSTWLEPLGISVRLLTGQMPAAERSRTRATIASGETLVVVGTHALFQNDVEFAKLALVIIDEQHRFGVHQRMALRSKGVLPHQIVMTATPIPRTLSMTFYADMDVSIIDELPPGRRPIDTHVVGDARRDEIIARIAAACSRGRQTYWVCTLIEESDSLDSRAAETTAADLSRALPTLSVGLLHGRLSSRDKATVMERFKTGEIDLLVATTVVEVGVDVPNATLMVIENPERLGLAQLHQLRGRVGRGFEHSHCVLLYKAPLSAQGRARLKVMRETTDGFRIAEEDLKLRGPGDVLGTRQTGELQFRAADLAIDAHLVPLAAEIAARIVVDRPELATELVATWSPREADYTQV